MFDGLSSRERINDSATGLTQTVTLTTVPAAKCWSPENQSTKPKKPLGFARLSREMNSRLTPAVAGTYVLEVTASATYKIDLTEEQFLVAGSELGHQDPDALINGLAWTALNQGFPSVCDVFTDTAGVLSMRLAGNEFDNVSIQWGMEAGQ